MTTIGIGVLWAAIAAVVALAVYRQVRAHIQLRKTLHDLGQTHHLLVAKLTAAAEALAQADAQEEAPSEDRTPSGALKVWKACFETEHWSPGAQAIFLNALEMTLREQLRGQYPTVPENYYWLIPHLGHIDAERFTTVLPHATHHGQCIRSSDDLIRVWQEEDDYRLLSRPVEAETL